MDGTTAFAPNLCQIQIHFGLRAAVGSLRLMGPDPRELNVSSGKQAQLLPVETAASISLNNLRFYIEAPGDMHELRRLVVQLDYCAASGTC